MKKALAIVATLTTAAATAPAHAQSSVELYGLLDYGIQYSNNSGGGRLIGGNNGVKQGSRWGLRGREDLGGGDAAIFRIENGFAPGTGAAQQGGLAFGRQGYVGLSSTRYGTLTLGRQYDSIVNDVALIVTSMVTGGGNTAHIGDLDNLNNSKRVNNAIKYTTPSLGGLRADIVYGVGGLAGDVTRNQIWSVGGNYHYGPVQMAAAYLNVRNPNQSFFTTAPTDVPGAKLNNMSANPAYSGYASAHTYQAIAAAANYVVGKLTLGVNYSNVQFKALGNTSSGANPLALSGTATFNTGEVNLSYLYRPDVVLGAVYNITRGSGVGRIGSSNYQTWSLAYDYLLSKRTDVYLLGSYQIAHGMNSNGTAATAAIQVLSASSSNQQAFVIAGIRHAF
ncbi:MAG: porin [Janthinobacterium lividum]